MATTPDNSVDQNRGADSDEAVVTAKTLAKDKSSLTTLETRNVDGTGNNLTDPDIGSAGETFIRLTPADYDDGIGDPADRGNPREISNEVMAQQGDVFNSFGVSDIFTYFGQFIDHDIDITPTDSSDVMSTTVPANDAVFTPGSDIEIDRSEVAAGTGVTTPREHINDITSFVDASNIYGSNAAVTALLRADSGDSAYLLTNANNNAPTLGQIKADNPGANVQAGDLIVGGSSDDFFVAGDVRMNENISLTSMHTVWIREHNFQVDYLKEQHPDWTNDQLFEAAKIIVEAEYQNIVFNEYLPLLLGADNIPDYQGYDDSIDPTISHEFASAAYRLGHSQLSSTFHRTNEDGSTSAQGDIGLFQAFFNPTELEAGGGVDPLIRGLIGNLGQEIDTNIVDDVRNLLFGPPGVGTDLASINIMRGRDHGIPALNDVREGLGLDRLDDFSDLTSNAALAASLASVYASIDDVDLWVGGLAEDKVDGSQLGETLHHIVLDQFMRLRDGDRFYFEERLSDDPDLLGYIYSVSLSDVIERNTGIDHVQDDAFIAHDRLGGGSDDDLIKGDDTPDLIIGFEGDDHLKGKEGDDDLFGDEGMDELHGGRGDDVLDGGDGRDILRGKSGDDTLLGGRGDDNLAGGDDEDRLDGGGGDDIARGNLGDDLVYGGAGDDQLFGGRGEDMLVGGAGDDALNGGGGDDIFVFEMGSGQDQIFEFQANRDRIDLSDYGFKNFNDVINAASQLGPSTMIDLDGQNGDTLEIVGVSASALSGSNFIFDDN